MAKTSKQVKTESEKVRAGMLMTGIIALGGIAFALTGVWIVAIVIFIILCLILAISFIISLFPKRHSKEYNKLNPVQKTFATASYLVEMVGYLSSIG